MVLRTTPDTGFRPKIVTHFVILNAVLLQQDQPSPPGLLQMLLIMAGIETNPRSDFHMYMFCGQADKYVTTQFMSNVINVSNGATPEDTHLLQIIAPCRAPFIEPCALHLAIS